MTNEHEPTISVCLLAYNHAALLPDAVKSVLAQDFRDYELILSDDCSTDQTWQVIGEVARTDARIRPLRTPRNLGMAAHANYAASRCRAPFIALLHHDDICAPDLLRSWLEIAQKFPDVGFVSNAYGNFNSEKVDCEPFPECSDGPSVLKQRLLRRWDSPFRGTALIRRSAWEAVGGMRERFGMLADVDLWMRLAARWPVGYVARPVIVVRQERPEDYPTAYKGFDWHTRRLTFEIHGVNLRDAFSMTTLAGRTRWLVFRARVSADVLYWLAYGIAKRRWDILVRSQEVETEYELAPEKFVRRLLAVGARALA